MIAQEVLAFRQSVYHLFSECFLRAPSGVRSSFLEDPEWRESAGALLGPEIHGLCEDSARDGEESLAVEYAALFVVPGPQQTFPFETNYREKRMLDGRSRPGPLLGYTALQVQRAYVEWGMPADLDTDELPDQAGVELRFMALLVAAERLMRSTTVPLPSDAAPSAHAPSGGWRRLKPLLSGSDSGPCADFIVRAERDFLRNHILEWFPQWLERLRGRARRPFYRSAAVVLGNFLETEEQTLKQLLSASVA